MWPLLGEQDLAELQVTTEYIAVVLHDKKSKSVMIVTEHSYCIHIQREIGKTSDPTYNKHAKVCMFVVL